MSGREQILAALRKHPVPPQPLPLESSKWIRYDSPLQQFCDVLRSVSGSARVVANAKELVRTVSELPEFQRAANRCCELSLPRIGDETALDWNVQLNEVDDPHGLASLDFALLPGCFAVAENGAVWVTDERLRHRSVYFIAQHLALVVPADQVVHNMHEAYERISFPNNAFGCFISGPSKTADIEQSLVIGAHGARSLTVLLIEDETTSRP